VRAPDPPSAAPQFHVAGAGTTDATRQVEVAALTAANLNYNNIDLVLVDGNANRVDQRNLAACTITRNQGANPTLDFIVCANWQANLAVSGTTGRWVAACGQV